MARKLLILVFCLFLAQPVLAVAVDEKPLADVEKEAQARALMKEIRCLVCQNQSIEDSNAELAQDLRKIVRERIATGDTPDNVRAYLVDRYGDWVLLEPPVKPRTYFLWASPFVFLLIILWMVFGRRKSGREAQPLTEEEQAELKKILTGEEGKK